MFPTMQVGHEEMALRPVNCPHHVLVYTHAERSYRGLPLRIAELETMYRMERSGVAVGPSRVRPRPSTTPMLFVSQTRWLLKSIRR